jgi:hypothetical protein
MEITAILSLVGNFAIGGIMIILALLSQRLGNVTHARHHYIWFYGAAILVWLGMLAQIILLRQGMDSDFQLHQDILWVLLIKGLPTLGLTIGLVVAWHYWSWLLAERD